MSEVSIATMLIPEGDSSRPVLVRDTAELLKKISSMCQNEGVLIDDDIIRLNHVLTGLFMAVESYAVHPEGLARFSEALAPLLPLKAYSMVEGEPRKFSPVPNTAVSVS